MKMNKKEYLKKIINFYYEKKNHIPGIEWIQKRMKMKTSITIEEIEKLIKELLEEGFLKKTNLSYILGSIDKEKKKEIQKITEENPISNIDTAIRCKCQELPLLSPPITSSLKKNFRTQSIWIDVLRYILLFIGLGAVYMSIYYSYIWLLDFLSPARALLLSLIMICFAVISFELIVFFYQLKKYVLVGIFAIMWFVVTFFSMISTVAGQYNSRMDTISKRYENQKNIESSNREYTEYIEQKEELQDALKILKQEYNTYQTLLLSYTQEKIDNDKMNYEAIQWRKNKAYGEIQTLLSLLNKLRQNKEARKVIDKSVPDFYLWMGGLWHWKAEKIQFWLSIFPAIFIDILAPLSFAVVIFVGGNERKSNKKGEEK